MECSKGRSIWHWCLLLALLLRPHWPPDFLQATMVRIFAATLQCGENDVNPADVLKPENKARAVAKMRTLEYKDVDAQCGRDLRERYPDYTYVDTHVRRIGGSNMFDEIRAKRIEVMSIGKRIPSSWWTAHRLKWAKITSPEAGLVVRDAGQPVPQTLIQAITTACSPNTRLRSSGPLIGWLQMQSVVPNQKSTCGIFRHSLSQYPTAKHLQVVIAIMKMVSKLHVQLVHVQECAGMFPHWDTALVNWLASSARAGLKEDVWLDNHAEMAGLVVNSTHIARVREASNVRDCSRELRELCSSSQLGQRVYGGLLAQLCFDEYVRGIDVILETLEGEHVDEDVLSDAFSNAEELARTWEFDERCSNRHVVMALYSSVQLKLPSHDAASLASSKNMCWVKSAGVKNGDIEQLWFEAEIMPREEYLTEATIAASICKPINCARKMVNEQASSANVSTGDLAVKMMESQQPSLESVDPSAGIEVALCRSLAAAAGEQKMEKSLFLCLPDAARVMTPAESLAGIEKLQESALFKFSSLSAQALLAEVMAAVKCLMRNQPPCTTSWGGSTSLKKLKDQILPLFMVAKIGSDGDEPKTVRGLAAAKQQLRVARDAARTEEINLGHIADLTTYDFLLNEEEANEVQVWLKSIWVKAGQAGATAVERLQGRSSSHNEATAPKKKRKIGGATAPEVDNVANLFT